MVKVLAGKSPQERASELVRTSKLKDVAFRKQLGEGGKAAVDASHDPMIEVARIVDARSRELRKMYDEQVDEPLTQAYAKIANAQFKTSGGDTYPEEVRSLQMADFRDVFVIRMARNSPMALALEEAVKKFAVRVADVLASGSPGATPKKPRRRRAASK